MDKRKRIFSGIKPTGTPTLGNFLGAYVNWAEMQGSEADSPFFSLYCVVDMHAITIRIDPKELCEQSKLVFASMLASGIDPEKSLVYLQSHVHQHAELAWILECYTMMGELNRMTQFKEKSQKNTQNINGGLFSYPVLMAADILLFDTDEVPVGDDQKQHVELARNIAIRFNGLYGDVFRVPEPVIAKTGARIMSLTEPAAKMSKSEGANPNSFILLTDSDDDIRKKFKKAVTDTDESENRVRYDAENKPGVSNLLTIYALCTGKSVTDAEREFVGAGYGTFKTAVGEAVCQRLGPVRKRIEEYLNDPAELSRLMEKGARRAHKEAAPVLERVRDAVGFVPRGVRS